HAELLEKDFGPTRFQQIDDLPCRVHFEALDGIGQVRGRGDEVKVVLQHHIAIQTKVSFAFQEVPGIEHNLHRFGPGEYGQPAHDGAGHEVGMVVIEYAVACAGHGVGYTPETEFRGVRSQTGVWERA